MSSYLFVVPPLVGHVNPLVGVASALTARGHRVAWAGEPALVRRLAGPDADVHACPPPHPPAGTAGTAGASGSGERGGLSGPAGNVARTGDVAHAGAVAHAVRPPDLRGPEALRFLWERFLVPLAEAMAPGVRQAVHAFRPDVVVADQQALAGALVAEDLGVPWATSATTSAEFADVLAPMPRVAAWNAALLGDLRKRIGRPDGTCDPRFSPYLVLAFTTPELAGPALRGGERIRWVGPSLAARPRPAAFPWHRLDPGRSLVLVTLGTANAGTGGRFLTGAADAVRARAGRVQAVVADPEGVIRGRPDDPDVIALPVVPQLDLLERAAAVVCHAGHNTVCEALWHGVPLVVAPIRDDQPVVAAQVARAGVGVRIRFGRAGAAVIGAALDTVLGEPHVRAAAAGVSAAFRAAGGAGAAADHLERLARQEDHG
ncbi:MULTISPECIES: glycosyltransferase [Streptomyces]|uniref:Glycosyl transferase n=2 Tax=Streptomyces TaxID=1883 RepID=A0A100YAF2_9ACTN|nr:MULTISPECIES: glycosyltransferase [Streptomyces]KUH40669.1 glycosyl transferase [Streptomyces kanasensis]UUS29488.1 glycosyltransferase [Streptomyces changanensis]